jgi:predicted RNase H-like HicB family nuclease
MRVNYHITLVESEEGFAVWCDDLPGCCSQGTSRQEALQNIRVAIQEYLEAQPEVEARFGTKVLPEILPEMAGDAKWEAIIHDLRPRPALEGLLDELEIESKEHPEALRETSDEEFERNS